MSNLDFANETSKKKKERKKERKLNSAKKSNCEIVSQWSSPQNSKPRLFILQTFVILNIDYSHRGMTKFFLDISTFHDHLLLLP